MKKFLFTLAALMMAGSLCAEEYLYIEDFEVSQDLLNQTSARNRRMTVDVKAHFDNYVSAWTVDLMTNDQENVLLPNMSVPGASEGADMTIAYIDELCNEKTIGVGLNKGQNNTRFIAASTVAGYYWTEDMDPDNDDPVTYGANKWLGDYDQMFTITFQFDPGFEGGVIQVRTQPASGQDPRGPITNGETVIKTFNITVEQDDQPTAFVGTADVTFVDNVATISYTSNDPNATVEVTMNGTPINVAFVDGVATWVAPTPAEQTEAGEYSYTVVITVTPDGVNFVGEPASANDTYGYTVERTATPNIIINAADGNAHHQYFTVEGNGDVHVYVDGVEVFPDPEIGAYVLYAVEGAPVTYVITATAQENGKLISNTAMQEFTFESWDGVNELVNGKTVAGVRYYNMAGQEMQQANGVTIVVTTYTDGTTSAVKVMK